MTDRYSDATKGVHMQLHLEPYNKNQQDALFTVNLFQ